jgi:dienelactone hydrolase
MHFGSCLPITRYYSLNTMQKSDNRRRQRIERVIKRRILNKQVPEDRRRCELNRFVFERIAPFKCPAKKSGWLRRAKGLRKRIMRDVYMRGHPEQLLLEPPAIEWLGTIETGGGYRIRKLRYEGYPGMWIPALLYEPAQMEGRVPAVLNPNGHHRGGKAMDYKQARCINLAKRGMLALNTEFIGMGELQENAEHNRFSVLDLCGVAGVGVFYLAMKRSLDLLLAHPHCDPDRVAMTGLSGGGWQTAVLSALDERVKVIVPVAGYSPLWQRMSCISDVGDLEQNPTDLCTVGDYDLLTALFAPRPTLLIYNLRDDCCFRSRRTRKSVYHPVKPLYELLGIGGAFRFYENSDPGTHNYEADSRSQLYRFLNEQFGLDTPETDLPYEGELRSASELTVGLPEGNANILTLAFDAMRGLPERPLPMVPGKTAPRRWVTATRQRLRKIIRLPAYKVRKGAPQTVPGAVIHRLNLNDTWTLPVVTFSPGGEKRRGTGGVQILLADGGRGAQIGAVERHLDTGRTVMVADVFGTGELKCPPKLYMTVPMVGERPLGIVVGQIIALAQWAGGARRTSPVRVSAKGTVISFAVLCAAALEPELFAHLHLDGMKDSLKRLIDVPVKYEDAVPLFCFGLLREIDVPELFALCEGLEIEWEGHGPVFPVGRI